MTERASDRRRRKRRQKNADIMLFLQMLMQGTKMGYTLKKANTDAKLARQRQKSIDEYRKATAERQGESLDIQRAGLEERRRHNKASEAISMAKAQAADERKDNPFAGVDGQRRLMNARKFLMELGVGPDASPEEALRRLESFRAEESGRAEGLADRYAGGDPIDTRAFLQSLKEADVGFSSHERDILDRLSPELVNRDEFRKMLQGLPVPAQRQTAPGGGDGGPGGPGMAPGLGGASGPGAGGDVGRMAPPIPPMQSASGAAAYGQLLRNAPQGGDTTPADRDMTMRFAEASAIIQDPRASLQQKALAYGVVNQIAGVPIPQFIRQMAGGAGPTQAYSPGIPFTGAGPSAPPGMGRI